MVQPAHLGHTPPGLALTKKAKKGMWPPQVSFVAVGNDD